MEEVTTIGGKRKTKEARVAKTRKWNVLLQHKKLKICFSFCVQCFS